MSVRRKTPRPLRKALVTNCERIKDRCVGNTNGVRLIRRTTMTDTVTIDLRQAARGLNIPLKQVEAVVELLDEGNTVPFITRYRKDRTGGLDEEQVRDIQDRLTKTRLLAERKQTILRSIEAQGKLNEKLSKQILGATTTKRLEDLYLPYKPKKQTLATQARERGLDQFAQEIMDAAEACANLDARAADYANPDKQVPTPAEALLGAGHIIAERFGEQAEIRQKLREIMQRTGVIISSRATVESKVGEKQDKPAAETITSIATAPTTEGRSVTAVPDLVAAGDAVAQFDASSADANYIPAESAAETAIAPTGPVHAIDSADVEASAVEPAPHVACESPADDSASADETTNSVSVTPSAEVISSTLAVDDSASLAVHGAETVASASDEITAAQVRSADVAMSSADTTAPAPGPTAAQRKQLERQKAKAAQQAKREQQKKKLEEKRIKAYSDYFEYREEIRKMPPHRVLALNRGEKSKVLRVKLEYDLQAMIEAAETTLVPAEHPHAEYLKNCARSALTRLILPSLEREARRELTDRAELHAVVVFAKNLRNLLLQPPVHDRRVLAIDPGYKSGCKLAALDQFGNLLEHGVVFLIGKPERREEAKQKVVELINKYQLTAVAIGNGTACREAEKFVAEIFENELKDQNIAYVIVNEAGASVYSTSRTGREEFPEYDATTRGGISIGRRLLDPLSELVKIDPDSIGVGLYQHDVKAKHLRTSLDETVASCVNYVGVDVNMASPDLLRYVSGLNQLTARRLYDYRREHGPFRNREQLRQVPGIGDSSFVQAAGFLKISKGDNPLDSSWIHPESYDVALKLLERLGFQPEDLSDKAKTAEIAEKASSVNLDETAAQLGVGSLTLKDILEQLSRPGRDPREDLPQPVFKHGILKLEDLTAGMELTGTVLNVVDFGCFVDIGMHDSGLVHVSHLADRYIRDPHEVVAVGDIVKVWVISVDKERRRVSLTMIQPGSEKPRQPRHTPRPGAHADGQPGAEQGAATTDGASQERGPRPPRPQGQRPPRQDGRAPQGQRPPRPEGERRGSEGGRPRDGERRRDGRGPNRRDQRPPRQHGPIEFKAKPAPKTPISEKMKEGKEPLRTFGDLMQFYTLKNQPTAPEPAVPIVADEPKNDAEQ